MQRERMESGENFVPSLREYSARWGVTPERLRPGQKVMHPGPMNRGVEIDPVVADSVDALIETQVRAGLVVRMAVLYDLLTHGPVEVKVARGGGVMLFGKAGPRRPRHPQRAGDRPGRGDRRAARRPRRQGRDLTIGLNVDANGHRVVEGRGLVLAPAFVDPHVHLRTPGREDEETIASGTAAAAAGGFCAILAMPNTEPVVDSAAVLGSLIETAREEAEVPVGFLAAITKGQDGEELTEMAELADAGAAGFSDDGRPVVAPGLMRRALQYHAITGLRVAPHCEEPTLSRGRPDARGRGLGRARLRRLPVGRRERDGRPGPGVGRVREPAHPSSAPLRQGVGGRLSPARRPQGVRATGEATPHHLVLTDEAVRSLDANLKMNPPLRSADDRKALVDAVRDGTITVIATDHAPHAPHEKDVPFEEAPFGVTGLETAFAVAEHPPRRTGAARRCRR